MKNDRLGSFRPALFALSQKLPRYPQKREPLDKLDQLLSARRGLSEALTRLTKQMQELPYARESLRPAVEGASPSGTGRSGTLPRRRS